MTIKSFSIKVFGDLAKAIRQRGVGKQSIGRV